MPSSHSSYNKQPSPQRNQTLSDVNGSAQETGDLSDSDRETLADEIEWLKRECERKEEQMAPSIEITKLPTRGSCEKLRKASPAYPVSICRPPQ
jgi:hypothetical protein